MFGKFQLWEINREERFYCALLAHVTLSSALARDSICKAINMATGSRLVAENLEVYVEIAALRDYWNRLDRPVGYGGPDPKLDVLRKIFELEGLAADLLDNPAFRTSTGKIPNPGHWNIETICQAFPEAAANCNWLDTLKKIKWSFNAKPDLLFVSGNQAVFVEAKVESGEDKYEGKVPQTEVQKKIASFIKALAPLYHDTEFFNTMLLLQRDNDSDALVWADLVAELEKIQVEHPEELDAFSMRCLKQLVYNNQIRSKTLVLNSGLDAAPKSFSIDTLDPLFLLNVLNNLGDDDVAVVRFGTTGKGLRPNYEIDHGNGESYCFKGANHASLPSSETFDKKLLSAPISQKELEHLIDRMAKPEIAQQWMGRFYAKNKQHYPQEIKRHRDELLRLISEGTAVEQAFAHIAEKHRLQLQ